MEHSVAIHTHVREIPLPRFTDIDLDTTTPGEHVCVSTLVMRVCIARNRRRQFVKLYAERLNTFTRHVRIGGDGWMDDARDFPSSIEHVCMLCSALQLQWQLKAMSSDFETV